MNNNGCFISELTVYSVGQRYDVIVNASQTADNYWFCIGVGMDCGYNAILSSNIQVGAIFHYDGASDAEPTTAGATLKTSYVDETTLTPWSPTPSHRPLSRAPLRKLLLTSTSIPPRTTSSNGLSMVRICKLTRVNLHCSMHWVAILLTQIRVISLKCQKRKV